MCTACGSNGSIRTIWYIKQSMNRVEVAPRSGRQRKRHSLLYHLVRPYGAKNWSEVMQLDGKVAVVSGGASGLGRATAERLHALGATVAILDVDEGAARAAAAELGDSGIGVGLDVTDSEAAEVALAKIRSDLGALHICVCCAGISDSHLAVKAGTPISLDAFRRVIDVNLTGTFNVVRVALANMLLNEPDEDGERGIVVMTSSAAAFEGQVGQVAYSASKSGIVGLTLPLAREFAGRGVRINAIAPGVFQTPMMEAMPLKVQRSLAAVAVGPPRLGRPSEFAALVCHVIENGYINGTCLRLDAGARLAAR